LVDSVERKPNLSVVVVVYNMAREAPRTLLSLSASYQRHINPDDYEVIVVDNGSNPPFDPHEFEGLSGNFRLIRIDHASPSPAQAINRGLAEARGDVIGIMIDGARIVTPGLLHFARHGACLYDKAVVATLGWYLGYDFQRPSMQCRYDHAREDALLNEIDWPNDGYRLFEIGTMDESSADGWFQPISESNALFLRRELWELLGGVDERFDAPGGGLINLDTFCRVLEWPDARLVVLLGEATFHQLHGGVATNAHPDRMRDNFTRWSSQYETIRGRPHKVLRPKHPATYVGTLPRAALARMVRAAVHPIPQYSVQPLGIDFNQELWTWTPPRSSDGTIAGLVDLAENEFRLGHDAAACAVARLIHERAPDEPGQQRLLSLVSPWLYPGEVPAHPQRADYHLALAEAHRMLGENEAAALNYREALTLNPNLPQAHLGLAMLRMPGDDYLVWLERLYRTLAPESVIEVGIYQGASLALLRPPTVAIGIDPDPTLVFPLKTETHIFTETSDEFFAAGRFENLLGGRPLSVGFIDGLHLFEQALRDFTHLERCCGPRSVILFHDTVALDEPTQTRNRDTQFHTGDVWKTILSLKHYRPDLDIFTIATPPTGLTVVAGLDPTSRVLTDRYEQVVARFIDTSFTAVEGTLETMLNVVPNDWSIVESRLKKRRII
jgi:glycosyltransferase involved in cell wall biosynthesis